MASGGHNIVIYATDVHASTAVQIVPVRDTGQFGIRRAPSIAQGLLRSVRGSYFSSAHVLQHANLHNALLYNKDFSVGELDSSLQLLAK